MARIANEGNDLVRLVPVVYDEPYSCGIGVFRENGAGLVWGLVNPRNFIAAWRGTEVLRLLNTIEGGTLCDAYYTGVRNPHPSDAKSHVDPTIEKIGRSNYDRIMTTAVPEQIIWAILDNQKNQFPPDLSPITEEVRAGTIQWREEFKSAGIQHPEEVDAKQRENEKTIAKFEKLLVSYAKSIKLHRESWGMGSVESAILMLIEKKVHETQPDHVVVALAGVLGHLALSQFSLLLLSFSAQAGKRQFEKAKKEAIAESAKWLVKHWGPSIWPWRNTPRSFTQDSAETLLFDLFRKHLQEK